MNKEEFTKLITENTDSLFHVSYGILRNESDAEDAVQSAIIKAYSKKHTLKNPEYAKTWLIRILINECKQLRRKTRKELIGDDDDYQMLISDSFSHNPDNDLRMDVWEALGKLDNDHRLVLILKYVEGFNLNEIARMTGVMKGTVGSRLNRARNKMKELLSNYMRG